MKIRQDKYGLFVIVNGGIFRPVDSKHGYPSWAVTGQLQYPEQSKYKAGDVVKGKFVSQTPFADVGGERWVYHGEARIWDDYNHKMVPLNSEKEGWNPKTS